MKQVVLLIWIIIPLLVQAQNQKLNVHFSNLKSNEGKIRVALFEGKENYAKKEAVQTTVLTIENNEAVWKVDSVYEGKKYILAAFHDENDNGKLDLGMMQIPAEGYVFSNNTLAEMGPPNPDKMLFEVRKNEITIQNLTMIYFDFSIFQKK
ncbi:MAG: DUF2141 domain-containing protein [Petrimonas sp.]|jgi:uncharacterized protein (DUF2141 family)